MDCRLRPLIRRRRSFALLSFFLSTTLAVAAFAAPAPTAKGYLDSGLRLYNEGHYEEAIRELRLGYALEPLPDILYTLGQASRKLGRCDEAIGYYRQYLSAANAASAAAARFQIERCEQQLRDAKAAAQAAAPPPPPPSHAVETPPPPPRRPFYKDALGMTLSAVGVGAAIAGGALLGDSAVMMQHSRGTLQQFDDALPRAQTMRTAGIVLTAGGGALLIGGVIRLALVARHGREAAR